MKRLLIALAAGCAASVGMASPTYAAPWQSIDQRQAELYQRIDFGAREGELTGSEAAQLRREHADIARIEAQYVRTGGLSALERRDLDERLDILRQRIDYQLRDNEQRRDGRWQSVDQRQDALYRRIDQGVRNGGLTSFEAAQLHRDFDELNRMEARYRRSGGGLSDFERRDLDHRFDQLSERIRFERRDRDQRADAGWRWIDQRQPDLFARIDQGVRSGELTSREAAQLRSEFSELNDIQTHYRGTGGGLSADERRDLDRRFDQLSQRIGAERQDRDRG